MKQTTIILLNLRFSDFYSEELFKRVKETHKVRLVAILDQHFKDRVGNHIITYLDETYLLEAQAKDGFLAEFDFNELCTILEKEMIRTNDIKIVCTDEFNLLNAGHLRRKYHLIGNTDVDITPFRDKAKMKHILQKAGIRVPRFKLLQENDTFLNLSESIGLPFVIKPIDSAGSYGVNIIHRQDDYQRVMNQLKYSTATFEIEEYIKGKLYHVDSCIQNNKLIFICANEYSYPNHEYTKGKTLASIPMQESSKLRNALISFAQQALAALGSKDFINHMEIFVTDEDELVFLEISARPPGGLLNLTHRINFAINLMDLDFYMQTGLQVELPQIEKTENAFWTIFPLLPGTIKKFHIPDVQSRVDIHYFRELGDVISSDECNSVVGKSAHAIFYHSDENILRQDFEYIRTFNLVETETI